MSWSSGGSGVISVVALEPAARRAVVTDRSDTFNEAVDMRVADIACVHADLRGKRSGSCTTEAWRQKSTGGEAFDGTPISSTQCCPLGMSINSYRIELASGCFEHDILLLQLHGRAVSFSWRLWQTDMERARLEVEVSRSLTRAGQ